MERQRSGAPKQRARARCYSRNLKLGLGSEFDPKCTAIVFLSCKMHWTGKSPNKAATGPLKAGATSRCDVDAPGKYLVKAGAERRISGVKWRCVDCAFPGIVLVKPPGAQRALWAAPARCQPASGLSLCSSS